MNVESIIIGSAAADLIQCITSRKSKDVDVICTPKRFEEFLDNVEHKKVVCLSKNKWAVFGTPDGLIHEVEIAYPGSSGEYILGMVEGNHIKGDFSYWDSVASLRLLYTLKMSHRYLRNSPHFHKTRKDILEMFEFSDHSIRPFDELLAMREKETYHYEHPNLNRTKEQFFSGDGVKYVFDHDSIHAAIAVDPGVPAYTKFKGDNKEVYCDMKKFSALGYKTKLEAVYEETCVLALERSVIPFGKDEQVAFEKSLEKVCTSITSGAFRECAWENYDRVLQFKKEQPVLYTTKFYQGIVDGVVKPAISN